MYHSITFGEKNTWDDWHLIPSSRPVFSPPQPNIRLLNIPGRSGSLDVTDTFGEVVYADRTGSFEFYVDHETEPTTKEVADERDFTTWESWADAYSSIANYLHGQKFQAILEDDPHFYYEGRFMVNEWRSNANFSTIVISYTVQPYKFTIREAGDDWLWDDFFFGNPNSPIEATKKGDEISTLIGLDLDSATNQTIYVELEGFGYRTIPRIECSNRGVYLYMDDNPDPIVLTEGENYPREAVITKGKHTLRFVGYGTLDINYRGGGL